VIIEIFYENQFYDMELLVESRDASETRSHYYSARSNVDITEYKGSKRIYSEMEPGDYTLKIIVKVPGAKKDI